MISEERSTTNLDELFRPSSLEQFLASACGKRYFHVAGSPGRFGELLPWQRLNCLLREHWLEPPRIRLGMEGNEVPARDYISYRPGHHGERKPRVDPVKLNRFLQQGATLILGAVDEMVEPIAQLAEALEQRLRRPMHVSAFATWGSAPGTTAHADNCDVLVLQVAGRKRWTIYGSGPEPSRPATNGAGPESAESPVWDQVLEDGDLLYIPRGWRHMVVPLAEPTLHLSFDWRNPTGHDFLRWLQQELHTNPVLSGDLPAAGDPAGQAEFVERLRAELLERLAPSTVSRYHFMQDAAAAPRPRFSLPWSATPSVLPADDEALIQWTVPRPVSLRDGDEGQTIELWANGERWQFARAAEAVLIPLMDGRPHSIAELCALARETLEREPARAFLSDLLLNGLIAVTAPGERDERV